MQNYLHLESLPGAECAVRNAELDAITEPDSTSHSALHLPH